MLETFGVVRNILQKQKCFLINFPQYMKNIEGIIYQVSGIFVGNSILRHILLQDKIHLSQGHHHLPQEHPKWIRKLPAEYHSLD